MATAPTMTALTIDPANRVPFTFAPMGGDGSGLDDIGKHSSIVADAALGHRRIFWVEFDQDGVALEPISYKPDRPGTTKRVQDGAARRASRFDAWIDKIGREGRKMSFGKWCRGNRPNRAAVAYRPRN